MSDPVNSPKHYNQGDIECIDAIESCLGPEAFRGYLHGNAMKYLWRHKYKGKAVEDLDKALWYVERLRHSYAGKICDKLTKEADELGWFEKETKHENERISELSDENKQWYTTATKWDPGAVWRNGRDSRPSQEKCVPGTSDERPETD